MAVLLVVLSLLKTTQGIINLGINELRCSQLSEFKCQVIGMEKQAV